MTVDDLIYLVLIVPAAMAMLLLWVALTGPQE